MKRRVQGLLVGPQQPVNDLALLARRVLNLKPCRRSTFNEPNTVLLRALSQQLPRRLIKRTIP